MHTYFVRIINQGTKVYCIWYYTAIKKLAGQAIKAHICTGCTNLHRSLLCQYFGAKKCHDHFLKLIKQEKGIIQLGWWNENSRSEKGFNWLKYQVGSITSKNKRVEILVKLTIGNKWNKYRYLKNIRKILFTNSKKKKIKLNY